MGTLVHQEAIEVSVEGHDLGVMLEGKRRQVRIVDEISRGADLLEQSLHHAQVARRGLRDHRVRAREPALQDPMACSELGG